MVAPSPAVSGSRVAGCSTFFFRRFSYMNEEDEDEPMPPSVSPCRSCAVVLQENERRSLETAQRPMDGIIRQATAQRQEAETSAGKSRQTFVSGILDACAGTRTAELLRGRLTASAAAAGPRVHLQGAGEENAHASA